MQFGVVLFPADKGQPTDPTCQLVNGEPAARSPHASADEKRRGEIERRQPAATGSQPAVQ